jgi:acetyl-CoA C-acetyltransferase
MKHLREVVICDSVRTPIGKMGGALKSVSALDLGVTLAKALLERNDLSGEFIDEIIVGQGYGSADAPAIGRAIAQDAGLPDSVGGMQVDRRCGSGLQAILDATMQIQTGVSELVLAGGAESMSAAPFYSTTARWGAGKDGLGFKDSLVHGRIHAGGVSKPIQGGMIETAENLRREYGISREDQDALAVRSQERALKAIADGRFDDEIVPVTVRGRRGDTIVDRDEHPRETTLEALSRLEPVRRAVDPEATVTAGNASGQNDAAALCIVTTREMAHRLNLRPVASVVSWARTGVAGDVMGIGPVSASQLALDRAGLTLADIDVLELNEAFAAQVLACTRSLGLTETDHEERINVNGSGISLGHPVGATGARILANLVREMERRNATYGLETMCIGGGQGLAAVFRNISAA